MPIPRMGKRADAIIISGGQIFVIEYKVGADDYQKHAIDQVLDYALDLKNGPMTIPTPFTGRGGDQISRPRPHRVSAQINKRQ
jgi:hypothetical protein